MIADLTDNDVEILAELVMQHGMLRYKMDDYRFQSYSNIAANLLEELAECKGKDCIKPLIDKFWDNSMRQIKEIEYDPKRAMDKFEQKKQYFQKALKKLDEKDKHYSHSNAHKKQTKRTKHK